MLTFAVGDIHGRCDLLQRALDQIALHSRRLPHQLVFLGDYVDRGPESQAVVELLMSPRNEGRVVCLLGNHERMLLNAARGSVAGRSSAWLELGGSQTLRSYDLDPFDAASARRLPQNHLAWFTRRPIAYPTGDQIYVHAGLAPERPFHEQGEREFLWIRERFLRAPASAFVEPRHIVHGHTPVWRGKPDARTPELLAHRSNLDTGAYLTHVLAVGVFETGVLEPVDVLLVTS